MARARIERVHGRRVWDSRGRPTVEAEIAVTGGVYGRAIAPAGASRGRHEAVELRDGGAALDGLDVTRAVAGVDGAIDAALRGMDIADQQAIDDRLLALDGTPNKARLGANATTAVSLAALHAAAAAAGVPVWRHLAGDAPARLPLPQIQIFGGGAHAARRLDIQDFLILPLAAASFAEAMTVAARVYHAAGAILEESGKRAGVADEGGWWPNFASNTEALDTAMRAIERARFRPGEEVALALDVAASQLRDGAFYRFEGRRLETGAFVALIAAWCRAYPIRSVEDPAAEDDDAGMQGFTSAMGGRVQVVGDDYLVTSAARIAAAAARGAANAALLKPNQAGTVSETRAALAATRAAGWRAIVSARSGESEDVSIVHLAVGWGADQLKVGSFARSERMAKWNEALRIEEALGGAAYLGKSGLGR
jgi:enolase 1/2/3